MASVPNLKSKDFLKYLIKYGCIETRIKSSHHQIIYPTNNTHSTVSFHCSEDLGVIMFRAILKDLKIDIHNFIEFINHN
jgi:predicted RNA binding protein YcfA (HicA-like mRNA interferase family)